MISRIEMIYVRSPLVSRTRSRRDGTHVLAHACLAQKLEEFQFAQCSETEHGVIERCDLLDGDFTTTGAMYRGANDAIGTFADDIEYLVLGA